jgi:LAS superfamily LD-carboxypeptidase LdcB
MPAHGSGGGYDGPLAYRMGRPMRPDVATAFDRMAAAARDEAGLHLSINSAFRSDAEQARLWAAKPMPHLFPRCRAVWRSFHPVAPT